VTRQSQLGGISGSGKENLPPMRVWDVEQESMEFAEFYESARDDCLRIVLLNVGDRQLAEDLVAEAFTRAWTSWRKVRELQAPQGWVVRTALNAHVSWWRRHRREVALGSHDIAVPADHDDAVASELLAALRRLPLRQREVVTLRLLLDLDTETTAKVLAIAPGTVGSHLHRAVASLRAAIPYHGSKEIRK
jgi:RNA polymerase sigma factor (sigma-70 family)